MKINNSLQYKCLKDFNIKQIVYEIFNLFFNDEILQQLIDYINEYAILYFVDDISFARS